jgi:rhomboid protease GluP
MRGIVPVLTSRWPLWCVMALIAAGEAVLSGADAGLWGSPVWRPLAYQYGGFWAGLWHGWHPNYDLQPGTMLLTYPFLHAGPGHVAGNIAGLWVIGRTFTDRTSLLLVALGAGVIGGAVAFGLVTDSPAPMVGASGGIFGLAGAWWVRDLTLRPRSYRRATLLALGGLLINVPMAVLTPGGIAWQTHVGGALAGVAIALWMGVRRPGDA